MTTARDMVTVTRTRAAFVDVSSRWVIGRGGSWRYEATGHGTTWSQTNSLELKRTWLAGDWSHEAAGNEAEANAG